MDFVGLEGGTAGEAGPGVVGGSGMGEGGKATAKEVVLSHH